MVDQRPENPPDRPPAAGGFRHLVVRKEQRKLRARREGDRGPWFWLGMFGLVGWSVAIPSLLGIAIGVWMDGKLDGQASWTLTMLLVGVGVGCWTAWFWIKRESERK